MIGLLPVQELLVFIGIPLAVLAFLAIAVYASSIADGPRYRPGQPWYAEPVWINGPEQAEPARSTAQLGPASAASATTTAENAAPRATGAHLQPATDLTGGASARW